MSKLSDLQRWKLEPDDMWPNPKGEWVHYEEVKILIKEKDKEIAVLKDELQNANWCESLGELANSKLKEQNAALREEKRLLIESGEHITTKENEALKEKVRELEKWDIKHLLDLLLKRDAELYALTHQLEPIREVYESIDERNDAPMDHAFRMYKAMKAAFGKKKLSTGKKNYLDIYDSAVGKNK